MEIGVLGPLQCVAAGEQLNVGGPRRRVVLAMLALNANNVTPHAQLVDAVWGEAPPATARSQIQICISGLRRLFTDAGRPNAIVTHASGYLLALGDDDLDLTRFTRLVDSARTKVDRGRTVEASDDLRTALALWRGPALMGIDSDLVRRGATLLDEQRISAVEEQHRLDLELGRHNEVISGLFGLVGQEPLRERLHGALMLALYRAGRQAEALEVYRRMRGVFVSELGIEPGRELQELEMAILNGDPRLDLAAPAPAPATPAPDAADDETPPAPAVVPEAAEPPRQLPADIPDFTGREDSVAEMTRHLSAPEEDGAADGQRSVRLVGISGKGGVGKSTLAVRVAHALQDAFPDGQLYANLHGDTGADAAARVLARFLRALGVASQSMPDDLEERKAMYRSRLAGRRVLVVLDDVTSEPLVRDLLPGSPSCAMITTGRTRLTGVPHIRHITLDVFDDDLSVRLLARIAGQDRVNGELPAAVELAKFCAGLPLALRIAGARLACRPHWRINRLVQRLRDEAGRLDEFAHGGMELRSTMALAYWALDARAQRLFRRFALLEATDFAAWTAAALLDTDLATAEDVIDELVDAQLLDVLTVTGDHLPRYRFHDLIKVYARERLADSEPSEEAEEALRRVLGGWMALAEESHRREYGGDFTILHGSAPRWKLPGHETADLLRTPMTWWESERRALVAAVRQAAALGMHELCWDLAFTCVTLFEAKGYFDDWRETSQLALDAAERAGNRRGAAAMRYSLGTLHMFQKRLGEAEDCFLPARRVFEEEGDVHGRTLVLRNMAFVDRLRGDTAGMTEKYETALRALRQLGDRVGEAHVLSNIARVRMDAEDYEPAREMLDAALTICRETGCLRVEAQVIYRLGELYLRTGDMAHANQAFNWALRIVRNTNDRIGECHALYGLGLVHWRDGRTDQAQAVFVQVLRLAEQVGERLIEGQVLHALGLIALAADSHQAARAHLTAARELFEDLGSALWRVKVRVALCDVHTAAGDTQAAAAEAAEAERLLPAGDDGPETARLREELFGKQILLRRGGD